MTTIRRLTEEEVQKITDARRAEVRRAQAGQMKRLEDVARQMMQGQQGEDYVPSDSSEVDLAAKLIAAHLNEAPGGEASFAELRELLQRFAVDPRLVMAVAKKWLCTQSK